MNPSKSLWSQLYYSFIPGVTALCWAVQLLSTGQGSFEFLVTFIVRILTAIATRLHYEAPEHELCTVITGVLLFLLLFAIFFFAGKRKIIRLILSGLFLFDLVYLALYGTVSLPALFTAIYYILETGFWFMSHLKVEQKEKAIASFAPFILALTMLALIIPSSETPIDWSRFVEIPIRWGNSIAASFQSNKPIEMQEFSVTVSGFSGEDTSMFPSGFLGNRNSILMKLSVQYGARGDGYLVGAIRNQYSAEGWERSLTGLEEVYGATEDTEYLLNFCEILYHLKKAQVKSDESVKICNWNVNYLDYDTLKTTSIFYPSLCNYIDLEERNTTLLEPDGKLVLTEELRSSYQSVGVALNQTHPELIAYLRGSKPQTTDITDPDVTDTDTRVMGTTGTDTNDGLDESEDSIDGINDELGNKTRGFVYEELMNCILKSSKANELLRSSDLPERLQKYEDAIPQNYLTLPDNIPKRVAELAISITQDCQNDYDKIMAIRDYLSSYPYTTSVEPLPEGSDFVDYFLFESKQGYCMHFATAMAVLARYAGIPSRYVEGVKADFQEKEEGAYLIRSYMAHAWCDVYFTGYGWFRVEATPGYSVSGLDFSMNKSSEQEEQEKDEESESSENKELIRQEQLRQEQIEKEQQKLRTQRYIKYVIIIVVSCVVLVTGLLCLFILRNVKRYRRSNLNQKLRLLFEQAMLLLQYAGYKRAEYETLTEYVVRLQQLNLAEQDYCEVKNAIQNYEEITYGEKAVNEEALQVMEKVITIAKRVVMLRKGKAKLQLFCIINRIIQ